MLMITAGGYWYIQSSGMHRNVSWGTMSHASVSQRRVQTDAARNQRRIAYSVAPWERRRVAAFRSALSVFRGSPDVCSRWKRSHFPRRASTYRKTDRQPLRRLRSSSAAAVFLLAPAMARPTTLLVLALLAPLAAANDSTRRSARARVLRPTEQRHATTQALAASRQLRLMTRLWLVLCAQLVWLAGRWSSA